MELNHDEIKELLPAYALGAVPEDEAAAIRAHIPTCEECMREADGYAETSARLALAGPTEPLPAGFADRVMLAATGDRATATATKAPARRRSVWPALAALGVVLIAAIATFQVVSNRDQAAVRDQANSILAASNGLTLEGLEGVEAAVVPAGVGSKFAARGLEEAPSGRTYQLWLIKGDRPVSAGTFQIEDGVAVLEVAQPVEDYDAAAVTIERAGGVDQPTTDPILSS